MKFLPVVLLGLCSSTTNSLSFSDVRPSTYLDVATSKKIGVQVSKNHQSLMEFDYQKFIDNINNKEKDSAAIISRRAKTQQTQQQPRLRQSLVDNSKLDFNRQLGIEDDPDFCLPYTDPDSTLGDYSNVELVTATEALDQLEGLRGANPDFYQNTLDAYFIDKCEKECEPTLGGGEVCAKDRYVVAEEDGENCNTSNTSQPLDSSPPAGECERPVNCYWAKCEGGVNRERQYTDEQLAEVQGILDNYVVTLA